MLYSFIYDTPIGKITVTADSAHIKNLDFGESPRGELRETGLIKRAGAELMEYFAGKRRRFTVPLAPEGTEYQKAVWKALCAIPYGETRSYGEIAEVTGNKKAARAAGMACGRNPIAIIVPCHRVIGKSGALTGFAGGLDIKSALLDIERSAPKLFRYGKTELDYLKSRDGNLARLIEKIEPPEYEVIPDLFTALVSNIMGQQVSMKAADTVWRRMKAKLGEITPEKVADTPIEELQSVGISMKKAGYIRDAALSVISGELDIAALKNLPDDKVCAELTKLRGVGRWTAEMLMIFSMERPDIFSFDDFGIRRGLCELHGLDSIDRETFESYRRRYSPYCSAASFYLWAIKDKREDI